MTIKFFTPLIINFKTIHIFDPMFTRISDFFYKSKFVSRFLLYGKIHRGQTTRIILKILFAYDN